MRLKIAQVVGLNTDQKAAQVISVVRDQDNAFLAVLILTCDDAFTKGRQALSELSDFYFDFEGSAAEKLNATFAEANKRFSAEGSFNLVFGVVSGKVLYLIGQGDVEVNLKRQNKISPLLAVGTPSQLISGFLKEGDRLLFATSSLTTFLGEDLASCLSLPIDTFEEEVSAKVGVSELQDQGLAGLMVEVEIEEQTIIPTLSKEEQGEETPSAAVNILTKILIFYERYFRRFFPKTGRGRLILALILILIIGLGAILQFKNRQDLEKQRLFNQTLQSAKDDYNAAKSFTTLNPSEAKVKLTAAKDKASHALNLKPNDSEAQNLKRQIDEQSSSILQQATVSEYPLFLDMDLVKKNFKAKYLSLSAGKLLLLDPTVKTLVVVDLVKKSHQILAGSEQLGDGFFASLNGGLAFVYSKDKGVLRVDIGSQKLTTVSKKDSDWGEVSDLTGFAGNVYLLDTGKKGATNVGQIWKYLPTAEGYSDKREYLSKNTKVDFSGSLRMQIESSIFVLKGGGEILRFTRGDKDHFSIGGLDKGVKDPKSFFVSSDTDNLYLLDSGNSRLLVLTKTGAYKGQYQGDKFAQATDLVVDEKGKKVYLLEGNKIYTVDLK